jgi:hypothetical protein
MLIAHQKKIACSSETANLPSIYGNLHNAMSCWNVIIDKKNIHAFSKPFNGLSAMKYSIQPISPNKQVARNIKAISGAIFPMFVFFMRVHSAELIFQIHFNDKMPIF